jgi:hypothetical protein
VDAHSARLLEATDAHFADDLRIAQLEGDPVRTDRENLPIPVVGGDQVRVRIAFDAPDFEAGVYSRR